MKKSLVAVILISLVVITAIIVFISKNETSFEKSATFKLVKTYGAETEPKEMMLNRVFKLAVDTAKNIYFVDGEDRMVSLANDGSFRWQINRKGKGPGDIENPRGIVTDGSKCIYLANINGTRIDKFDLNGNFISTLNAGDNNLGFMSIIGFIKPNKLVISKAVFGKIATEVIILDIDNNHSIIMRFIIDRTSELKIFQNGSLGIPITTTADKIVTGSITTYNLSIYNTEGKEEKTFKKITNNLFLAYASDKMIGIAGSISPPYRLKDGYYLVLMNAPTNVTEMSQLLNEEFKREYAVTIDIFNEFGNIVCTKKNEGRTNPEIGRPIHSDSEGYLYTFKEMPYPQICKYEVIISDKK